ncbi:MAG: hypothetical protein K9M56_02275 [Victivallales bacterium]|nr:hypothetical protein [Victivallales bacterium]
MNFKKIAADNKIPIYAKFLLSISLYTVNIPAANKKTDEITVRMNGKEEKFNP